MSMRAWLIKLNELIRSIKIEWVCTSESSVCKDMTGHQ